MWAIPTINLIQSYRPLYLKPPPVIPCYPITGPKGFVDKEVKLATHFSQLLLILIVNARCAVADNRFGSMQSVAEYSVIQLIVHLLSSEVIRVSSFPSPQSLLIETLF